MEVPHLTLDNFHLESQVPEDCPYVLTSPRSLEACAVVGVQPVELLGSPLSEYEALFPHLPRHQVLALFREVEGRREEQLQFCRQVRASLLRGTGPPSPTPANRLSCLSPIVEANSRTAVQDDEDDQPEVDQHLSPREEDAMELELERLRIEERFHGAFESCGGSSLDSLELRALSPSPETFAHLLQRQREALRKVPEKRKAERSTRISHESLQEVARGPECKGCHHCRAKETEKGEGRRGGGVTLASSSLLREALARSSIDIEQVVVSRQDMKLLEVLAGRVREERREEEVRQRLLQEWQAERRRREEEKEEEERQVV